jgi:hypothetical protein
VFENGLLRLAVKEEWTPPRMARFFGTPSRHVRKWHKADMLNALMNVRFWEQTGHLTNRCLPISIYEYTA